MPLFPPMLTSMIRVGEETGALPDMLSRIAEIYDDEVDYAIEGLTTLIEPALIVLMAIIVGTIVVALFLPLAGIIQQL
jgi:type IV pilus assembly protein PilC